FYREEDHRSWPSDAGTLAHAGLACVQAQQGLVEHARAERGRLLALTERLESPSQKALGYLAATGVDACLRDAEAVLTKAARLLGLTVEHEFPVYMGWARSTTAGRSPCLAGPTRASPSFARGSRVTWP